MWGFWLNEEEQACEGSVAESWSGGGMGLEV